MTLQASERKNIQDLEDSIREKFQNIADDLPVAQFFSPGLYARALYIPANTVLTGKIHKGPCLNILLHGEIIIRMDDGRTMKMKAPCVMPSGAGSKKAGYALTDTIFLTVHPNPENVSGDKDEMADFYTVDTFEQYDALAESKENAMVGQGDGI
jgi:hypothetical protein